MTNTLMIVMIALNPGFILTAIAVRHTLTNSVRNTTTNKKGN